MKTYIIRTETQEKSKRIQEACFKQGIYWASEEKTIVEMENSTYLWLEPKSYVPYVIYKSRDEYVEKHPREWNELIDESDLPRVFEEIFGKSSASSVAPQPLPSIRDLLPDVYGRKDHQRLMAAHRARERGNDPYLALEQVKSKLREIKGHSLFYSSVVEEPTRSR